VQLGMLKVLVPKKAADEIFGQNSRPKIHRFHPLVDASDDVFTFEYTLNYWEVLFFQDDQDGIPIGKPCRDMVL